VAAVPGITFCRAKGGAWTVRYHLDAWLRSRGIREVMVAYDNEDRVSRWRCPECGNTDIAISQAQARQSAELPLDHRAPRGVRTGKPNCCGKPMKENPGFKQDEWSRWDSVIYALLLGQELEKLGIDARFMLIPDELRDPTSGKVDWDSALASLLFQTRQTPLPIEPPLSPSMSAAPESDDLPDDWRE
jgi:hypothetical protein